MANLFVAKRGALMRDDPDKTPSLMTIDGIDMASALMLVTLIQIERNQVTQYIKTLDSMNFGYAWGEGPGVISVAGLIFFSGICDASPKMKIVDFYEANNVYTKGAPIEVSISDYTTEGYLESLQISAEQNEYNYGTFTLRFTILPQK
jgi:hypothetical protein